jgi:glyoxylase-like metal-dependent hydrolase (beta-lactamase superfamily II)
MFSVPAVPAGLGAGSDLSSTLLSGDVLFAGSIGRTDLPGGSSTAMTRSLRERVLPLPDETLVLPGHGQATTIGRERAVNPYLQQAAQ